jgi:hypothetical protein
MSQVLLRRRSDSPLSVDAAMSVIATLSHVKLVSQSGDNLLVEAGDDDLERLRGGLPGWIVAPQGARIPVPDTRRTLR